MGDVSLFLLADNREEWVGLCSCMGGAGDGDL